MSRYKSASDSLRPGQLDRLSATIHDRKPDTQIILNALNRFKAVLGHLECECDAYHGFTCTIHSDKRLVDKAIREVGRGKNDTT